MDEKLLIKKIQAILHDPPEKPIILGRIGHEGRAREIMGGIIDEARIPEEVKTADHIASAADRINLPKDEHFVADFRKNPVIKHPLSAKEFDLKSLNQIEMQDITAAVDRAIGTLSDKYQGESEKIYLALWRELLDCLKDDKDGEARLGQLWELLPADTRIPDHSIWEHKRITSAIAGALPKPAFLLFAIGPVQEFIATARKTQDLWAGSYLLSYLSWSAMKVVAEEFGPDSLIFPDLCGQPFADLWLKEKGLTLEKPNTDRDELSSPTLPNRFLAIVPAAKVLDIAEKAKARVKEIFKTVCWAVKEKMEVNLNIKPEDWNNVWERQTEDFIETYWSATVVDDVKDCAGFISEYKKLMGITDGCKFADLLKQYTVKGFYPNIGTAYGQIYKLIEKALGSRKAVRDFSQQDEPNHKCTLCGVREPVHPGIYNEKKCTEEFGALKGFWQEVISVIPDFRKSERLCGVCATKRLSSKYYFKEKLKFDITDNFPSVSMVATAAFKLKVIENINHNHLSVKVGNYVDAVKNIAGERWSGVPMPMVIRAGRDEISKDFTRLEGDWLYKEAFDDGESLWEENKKRFQDDKSTFNQILNNAREKHRVLFTAIKEFDKGKEKDKHIGSPSTYYAILLMDGDNMGKWLSGENAPPIEEILHPAVRDILAEKADWQELLKQKRPLNPSLHLATSKALRDFSLHVAREIVEKDHLGKLVYAGGDDVLAFVNLRDLSKVMEELRAYFSGSLKVDEATNKVDIDFKDGKGFIPVDEAGEAINVGSGKPIKGFMLSMGTRATASMGVVIAHHNSNLSQVLEDLRKCEKEAKKIKDKNAFCIALAKRSGGTEQVSAKWFYNLCHSGLDPESSPLFESIPLLRDWADAFYNDYISPKIVYTFRTETIGLEGLPAKAIELELLRIADRQRNKKAKDFDKKEMERLVDGSMRLHTDGKLTLDEISKFLSVAAFLGREGNR